MDSRIQEDAQEDAGIEIFNSPDGTVSLSVHLKDETMWLDAHEMARLFGRDRSVIVKHVQNIYREGELDKETTCAKVTQVAKDGKRRVMDEYNLDMIISVGYRVNSKRGTQFRIWATQILKQHLVQGYTVNQQRLKELTKNMEEFKELQGKFQSLSGMLRSLPLLGEDVPSDTKRH
jgi:hypothetical protein